MPASRSSVWPAPEKRKHWPKSAPVSALPASCRSLALFARATSAAHTGYSHAARRRHGRRKRPMPNRWWVYQKERFPVLAHGILIAAFSFSAVSFSSLLRGQNTLPAARTALVAFGTAFLFFLQLRLA